MLNTPRTQSTLRQMKWSETLKKFQMNKEELMQPFYLSDLCTHFLMLKIKKALKANYNFKAKKLATYLLTKTQTHLLNQ